MKSFKIIVSQGRKTKNPGPLQKNEYIQRWIYKVASLQSKAINDKFPQDLTQLAKWAGELLTPCCATSSVSSEFFFIYYEERECSGLKVFYQGSR